MGQSAGCGPGGVDGVDLRLSGGAKAKTFPGAARSLRGPGVLREHEATQLELEGLPGDRVWLISAQEAGWKITWPFKAPLLLAGPSLQGYEYLGTLPSSGSMLAPLQAPSLPVGIEATRVYTQALFHDLNGNRRLSGSWTSLVVDGVF